MSNGTRRPRWSGAVTLLALVVLAVPNAAAAAEDQTADVASIRRITPSIATSPATELALVFPQRATVTWFDRTYGSAKPDGRRHKGEDLVAPKMTPVYAVADGVVTRMRKSPMSGNHLVVDHRDGWTSWYMHLNNDRPGTDDGRASREQTYAPGLEVGDFVVAGQLIGYVGDSGNAEGTLSHTHFELHHDGRTVDPYPYLQPALERAREVEKLDRLSDILARME